jgi:hypothetical protein
MAGALRSMAGGLAEDVRRGMRDASGRDHALGALAAMPVSGPMIAVLTLASPLGAGAAAAAAAPVQLALGWALAGRLAGAEARR